MGNKHDGPSRPDIAGGTKMILGIPFILLAAAAITAAMIKDAKNSLGIGTQPGTAVVDHCERHAPPHGGAVTTCQGTFTPDHGGPTIRVTGITKTRLTDGDKVSVNYTHDGHATVRSLSEGVLNVGAALIAVGMAVILATGGLFGLCHVGPIARWAVQRQWLQNVFNGMALVGAAIAGPGVVTFIVGLFL
jgi:hypothetical protein